MSLIKHSNQKALPIKLFFSLLVLLLILPTPFLVVSGEDRVEEWDLPANSWTFIRESDFEPSQTVNYEWVCNETVNGLVTTEETFQTIQNLSGEERVTFFEQQEYISAKFDRGNVRPNQQGEIFFVFYNLNNQEVTVQFTYSYSQNALPGWTIGLVAGIFLLLFLIVIVIVISKLRKQKTEEEEKKELSPQQRYLQ
ncbi:MAG: hypothetical protein GF308_01200 [Candidatus Heimdallarchaeota archaeon]|nr:hypothetical protein [Candidatus Heimdallarchaeota archaeon]